MTRNLKILKASAGSGKTYSLARKYISLLLESQDRYAYRHILAVTFTNKATDEMKGRILKELHVLATDPLKSDYYDFFVPSRIASGSELQKKARTVLSDMLHDYSAFAVSTIDRFFQQTLKAFSREIGQFASYQVELDKDSLVAESVDRVLDSLTEDNVGLLSWLTRNVLEQIEQGGRYSMDANLLEMAKRLKSIQRQEVLEKYKMSEQDFSKEKLLQIRNECRNIVTVFREKVIASAKRIIELTEQQGVALKDTNRGFLQALCAYAELDDNEKVEPLKPTFVTKALKPDQWFAKAKSETLLPLVRPFIETPLQDFCELFDKEFKVYNTALILDDQLYGLGVAGELDSAFKELMKEKNVLCIDDSNTILRNIIDGSDAPFVYEKLGVRYEHFLLDEFQDTSCVQWDNFFPLLDESISNSRDNLVVGDVKQSIYRWRGSDWKLLDETVPSQFPGYEEEVLDTNFRSFANVVNFNNCFFKSAAGILDLMSGSSSDGSMSKIYSDVKQKVGKKASAKGSVTLTFCDSASELDKVLEAVNEARDHGAMLSEIAVLVRSNAIGESVATFLIDKGISVVTDDSLKVKNSMTVRRLVSLMSYIDNPLDTVNGYLAETMDVTLPEGCSCLMDMAESLFRSIKNYDKDEVWKGEVLHIQSFFDHLQDYVSTNGNSLRGFLKYWAEKNPSISSPSSGNSVRVMTIHKSKGLDFPYVIIPYVENINLYKASSSWCYPALEGTPLSSLAEGVYDVTLSKNSEHTLFAEDYAKESFMQKVDNINTIYVAMTRPVLGIHLIAKTPSAKCIKALESGDLTQFADFSQMLYWFASSSCLTGEIPGNDDLLSPFTVVRSVDDQGVECFRVGEMVEFSQHRKSSDSGAESFQISGGDVLPSIPLNPADEDILVSVKERGRLKFSAESVEFFTGDGAMSSRLKGIVLHDILSRIETADDLHESVRMSVLSGDFTEQEAQEAEIMLASRLAEVDERGWYNGGEVMNETSLINSDGKIYRPDRVILKEGKAVIVDYKFGEHDDKYVEQLRLYSDMWRRMGYADVEAYLWYVFSGDVVEIF